jgi:hypothetical protein
MTRLSRRNLVGTGRSLTTLGAVDDSLWPKMDCYEEDVQRQLHLLVEPAHHHLYASLGCAAETRKLRNHIRSSAGVAVLVGDRNDPQHWIKVGHDTVALREARMQADDRLPDQSTTIDTRLGALELAQARDGPPLIMIHGTGGGFDQGLPSAAQTVCPDGRHIWARRDAEGASRIAAFIATGKTNS